MIHINTFQKMLRQGFTVQIMSWTDKYGKDGTRKLSV